MNAHDLIQEIIERKGKIENVFWIACGGSMIDLEHEIPAMLGTTETVKAVLREIRGNRLIFDVTGTDALGTIFRGVNERVVVNRLGLDEKGAERAQHLKELKERL